MLLDVRRNATDDNLRVHDADAGVQVNEKVWWVLTLRNENGMPKSHKAAT